ncbi:MAG: hypothetical protein ACT4P4_04550 [Betaproteobacteria bacterium]
MLALLAAAVGASPLRVIVSLLEGGFGSPHALASTVREAVPVALCALTFLAAYRAGFFNIGAQGPGIRGQVRNYSPSVFAKHFG